MENIEILVKILWKLADVSENDNTKYIVYKYLLKTLRKVCSQVNTN